MAANRLFTDEELAEFAPSLLPGNPEVSEGIDPELDSVLALLPGMGVLPSSMRKGLKGGLESAGAALARMSPSARKAARAAALKEVDDAARALKVAKKNPALQGKDLDKAIDLDELEDAATELLTARRKKRFGTVEGDNTVAKLADLEEAATAVRGAEKGHPAFGRMAATPEKKSLLPRPYTVARAGEGGAKDATKTVLARSEAGARGAAFKSGLHGATGAMPKSRGDLAAWVVGGFNKVPGGGPIAKVANLAGFAAMAVGIEQLLEGAFDYRLNPKDVERAELQKEQFLKAVGQISEEEAILNGGGAAVTAIGGRMDRALEGVERRDRLDMTRLMSENGEALRSVAQPQGVPLAELYMKLMGGQQ